MASAGLYVVQPLNDAYAQDLNQLIGAENGTVDSGARALYQQISAPTAPAAAINSTAGNLTGAYSYAVTFETGSVDGLGNLYVAGETQGGAVSNTVTPSAEQVNLSAIEIGPVGTIARRVWRTKAGGSTYYLLTTLTDNVTTSLTDNAADSSLSSATMPTANTTGSSIAVWVGTSAPPNPQIGTVWADIATGILNVYNGTAWVAMSTGDATISAAGIVEITQNPVSGAPVAATRVAACNETEITGTTAQTVLSYTPSRQGNFKFGGYYRLTSAAQVTITITYADAGGAQTLTWYSGPAGQAAGSYSIFTNPTINAVTGTAIAVQVTCTVANACFISGTIEGA